MKSKLYRFQWYKGDLCAKEYEMVIGAFPSVEHMAIFAKNQFAENYEYSLLRVIDEDDNLIIKFSR